MTSPTYQPSIRDSLKAANIPPADEHPELYEDDDFDPSVFPPNPVVRLLRKLRRRS